MIRWVQDVYATYSCDILTVLLWADLFFSRGRLLGEFAVVYLASDRKTQKTYALKTLSKLHLLEHTTNAIEATMHEKEIMSSIHHPFIMGMHASFQDERYVYLLLPLFQGGELFGLIYKEDRSRYGLKDDDAIFYSACVVEALAHLHSR